MDASQLTPEQQGALEQYTQVTAQEPKDAIPLLERSQWNVQIAVAKFFDGEGPDPVAEAIAAQDHIPQQAARHENLQETLLASSSPFRRPPQRARPDPAPRIVPQSASTYRPPLLLAVLFAPFSFGYRAVSTIFRTFLYIFTFLPSSIRPRAITTTMTSGFRGTAGRRQLLPRDTASRFRREFEEEYGSSAGALPWFDGGFAQALDAAKRDLKFLLLVLMSPEHDDTESFVRDILLHPDVVTFITEPDNNILLWGGNVLDSEAYQVAAEYHCTRYPFSCLICLTPREGSTRMSIIKKLSGPVSSPQAYLSALRGAMDRYSPDLVAARADRDAANVARNLRDEQDSAYERSLATDRERARQRREAAARAQEEEKRAKQREEEKALRAQQRQQWRRWRAAVIEEEPDPKDKDVVRLALMMPGDVGRVVRRFRADASVEELYAFIECYDLLAGGGENAKQEEEVLDEKNALLDGYEKPDGYVHRYGFRVASPMPRVVYEPDEHAKLGEKIGRSGNLIVEELSPEELDEEVEGTS
ncbi:hypothetical protein F4780DRAFT_566526 [Xylariomycetidae sp. FL0641]|nr:hypothetical protein F4780DRAFT_566526 [Xylariomycetidae sp. FL0641]